MNSSAALKRMSALQVQTVVKGAPAPSAGRSNAWLPAGYEAFDKQGVIAMPAAGNTAVVLEYIVRTGWQGMIRRFSANITGPGFVQGDGSLIWSIVRNGVAVRGYESLLIEMGTIAQPRTTDGIQVYSGQRVQLLIQNVGYMAGGNVIGTLAGLLRPSE